MIFCVSVVLLTKLFLAKHRKEIASEQKRGFCYRWSGEGKFLWSSFFLSLEQEIENIPDCPPAPDPAALVSRVLITDVYQHSQLRAWPLNEGLTIVD